jgi:hypothetical protein
MAKAADIVAQLQSVLVNVTDLFNQEFTVTSLTNSGGLVTATTSAPHGLATGDYIYIKGAVAPVPVATLTQTGNVASGNTYPYDHDLTLGYQENVSISGADQSEYNGENQLLAVPNRYEFSYQISGDPVSPATTSTVILLNDGKERGYNGNFQITVTSPTTFTYPITGTVYSPAQGTIKLVTKMRISSAAKIETVLDAYSKQSTNDLWAFVVLEDTDIGKDRMFLTDAKYNYQRSSEFRQREIQPFSVYVFVNTTQQKAAAEARDLMEDVRVYLYRSLIGVPFENGLNNPQTFCSYTTGHGFYTYVNAYYVHRFQFEINNDITFEDTVPEPYNVAFRDINLIINNSPDELVTADVNLDVEPYES